MPSLKRLLHCLFYLSHGLYKDLTLWDQPCWKTANNSPVAFAAVAWARCQGGGPHMWTLELELLSDQGRAWKWVRVIEWNWTVLPLIRCIKKGGLFLSREPVFGPLFHSSRPLPTSAFHQRPERSKISARLEAFLWGLGAAAAARTKPDQKKRQRRPKGRMFVRQFDLFFSFFALWETQKKKLTSKEPQSRNSCLRWEKTLPPSPTRLPPFCGLGRREGEGGEGLLRAKDVTAHAPSKYVNSGLWQLKRQVWILLDTWGLA